MKQKLTIALCGFAFALSGCSSWFYGESNLPEPKELPKVENQVNTQILWSKNLGRGGEKLSLTLHPTAIGQTVYAVSVDGKFYSIDAQTGQENYRINLGNDIVGGVSAAGNYLLVGTKNGDLMAIAAADGQVMWRTPLHAQMLSPATFSDSMVVAHTVAGEVIALNPADGSVLWQYHANSPSLTLRGNSSPIVGGGVVIVATDTGFLTVLNEKTGLPIANNRVVNAADNQDANAVAFEQTATPQVNNAMLFGSAYQQLVYAIDLQAGQPKWQNTNVSSKHDFAISPTDVYLTTPEDKLVALSQTDGHELWHNDQLSGRRLSPPVAIPNRVGVVDYEGYLSWFNAADGQLVGQQRIGKARAAGSALVLQDAIVWQLADGQLVAVRPN